MKINPRLYQAMDLLYMPLLDLQQHLKQELLNNPFLDLVEGDVEEMVEKEKEEESEKDDDEIDWEEILLNGFETGGRREEYEEREYYEPVSVDTRELADHLHDQLTLLRLSERDLLLGEEIIGNVTDEGYLACGLAETVQSLNDFCRDADGWDGTEPYTLEEGERMLRVIQAFDPAGIAARDLRECILLQLRDSVVQELVLETGEGEPPAAEVEERLAGRLAYRIVDRYFDQLIN
ncbi:MAG TPA: hypothetical protein VEW03_10095, partial [Longimicrobiaceae bacterium]|nr:hypothetical protein [Longimicrobiaceae bacterium]